jgi:hypothetical protein
MAFPEPPQQNRPLWQYLLAPMLLLSLVLHGVVLFVPTGVSEDALVPPPDPEEDGIAISRIEPPRPRAAATNPPTVPRPILQWSQGSHCDQPRRTVRDRTLIWSF